MPNNLHASRGDSPDLRAWEDLLVEFRALGGVAENVVLGRGSLGRGLFPRDPAKPFLVRLPDNLLFSVDDVEFVDDGIRIRHDAQMAPAERHFFERYEREFSWGGGGREESAKLVAMFDSLPPQVRSTLIKDFGMQGLLEGDPVARTRRRFLESRMIIRNSRSVVMPLIELANYGADGCTYDDDPQGLLQIEGEAEGEILVVYGRHDSFDIFRTFGFASARPWAYSQPIKTKVGTTSLAIASNLAAKTIRAGIPTPEMKIEGGEISLSHLMIGNADYTRLSRGIFYTLMREANVAGAEESFDLILHANRQKFIGLIGALEPHRGEMVVMLRRMVHFQLEAMAHCVGSREL